MKKAFTVIEDVSGDNHGFVVFEDHAIVARRRGADMFNDGDIRGMRVKREHSLDKYSESGAVPMKDMVSLGWWSTCSHCCREINSGLYEDILYNSDGDEIGAAASWPPIGIFGSIVFCDIECKKLYDVEQRRNSKVKIEEVLNLKNKVDHHFVNAIMIDDPYVYVRNGAVVEAHYRFSFRNQDTTPIMQIKSKADENIGDISRTISVIDFSRIDIAIDNAKVWMRTQLMQVKKEQSYA